MSLGAPAAASKVLGYSDAKCSIDAMNCPMWLMLKESSAAFDVATPPPISPENNDNEDPAEEQQLAEDDGGDKDDNDEGEGDVIITTTARKLRVSTSVHNLYFRRCLRDDTSHPYHGMCFIVGMRLVRIE